MERGRRSVNRMNSNRSWPMIAAITLAVVAILTSGWAVVQMNRVDSLEADLSELRANASASYYTLARTESAPTTINGQVFLSMTGSGVVTISNAPQPGDNEEYRLWFLRDENDEAVASISFSVDSNGQGFALIPADTSGYDRLAISLEPAGAETPGGAFLLTVNVRASRG